MTSTGKRKRLRAAVIIGGLLAAGAIGAIVADKPPPVPVRPESGSVAPAVEQSQQPAPAPEDPRTEIERESDAVAAAIRAAAQDWSAHVRSVDVMTLLRRPVVVVTTDISGEEADLAGTFSESLSAFAESLSDGEDAPLTYCLQVRSTDGETIDTAVRTDGRWRLESPPTPTDAATLLAWLDQVYGSRSPAPEAWFERIVSISGGDDDPEDLVVIRTRLDAADADAPAIAQTIMDAANSSGATFASGMRVVFADGEFEWSGMLTGVDRYGP